MSRGIVDKSTEEGRRIWTAVEKAAAGVPEWIKEHVEAASRERARAIRKKRAKQDDDA